LIFLIDVAGLQQRPNETDRAGRGLYPQRGRPDGEAVGWPGGFVATAPIPENVE